MLTNIFGRYRSGAKAGRGWKPAGRDDFAVRDLMPAVALLVMGLAGLMMASLATPGRDGRYLVLVAPWASFGETLDILEVADGGLLDMGGFPNIVMAASARVDFADRAREAGAWLVLPSPFIAGCFGGQTKVAEK